MHPVRVMRVRGRWAGSGRWPHASWLAPRPASARWRWPGTRILCVAVPLERWRLAWAGARRNPCRRGHNDLVASYYVNPQAVAYARQLIDARQYVLDSDWGKVQPRPRDQNAFLRSHSWDDYARWHLGLTDGARDHTKARYAFVYGDFRRVHRMGIIACHYRAAEWRHKDIELAAHDLLQYLDARAS